MTAAVAWAQAETTRRGSESLSGNGTKIDRCDYFGPPFDFYKLTKDERLVVYEQALDAPPAPQGFMVQQSPSSVIPAHFHRVPQYQVMVNGRGKLGRNEVEAVAFHYTDEYTAYGPILSSEDGLWYCTLRGYFDPGANYTNLAEARAIMRPSKRRFILVGQDKVRASSADALAARTAAALDTVIEPEDDGVAAWMLRLGPNMSATGPDPATGGGQYYLVTGGALRHEGREYPRHSLLWLAPTDQPLAATAAGEGCECAVLQLPRVFSSRARAA